MNWSEKHLKSFLCFWNNYLQRLHSRTSNHRKYCRKIALSLNQQNFKIIYFHDTSSIDPEKKMYSTYIQHEVHLFWSFEIIYRYGDLDQIAMDKKVCYIRPLATLQSSLNSFSAFIEQL